MTPKEAKKTEIIATIWRLIGERRAVISKCDDLQEIVMRMDRTARTAAAAVRGHAVIEKAIRVGLEDVEGLIWEALCLMDALEAEEEGGDDAEVPDDRG